MRIRDLFFLSTRMFKDRPMRTFLTILGVGVGVGAILFLVSLGFGLQRVLLEKITTDEALLSLDVTTPSDLITLDDNTLSSLRAVKGVEEVSPLAVVPSQVTVGELNADVAANVVDPSYLRFGGVSVKEGRALTEDDPYGIVVSRALATAFNISPSEALGKEARFIFFIPKKQSEETLIAEVDIVRKEEPYTIVGVIEEDIVPLAYVPRSNLKNVAFPSYEQIKVKVKEETLLEPVQEELVRRGFMVSALTDTIEQANTIFRVIQIILSIFGVISLLVASIGMFNTLTIALLERTNDIGIMRAIGASRRDVWMLFVSESVIIGFLGGLAGIVLGIGASQIFNWAFAIFATALGGTPVNLFVYPIWFLLFILIVSTLVGFGTGIWPARRAANLNPLQALRYK